MAYDKNSKKHTNQNYQKTMATELFEDIFEVRQLNPDGKKFDKGIKI